MMTMWWGWPIAITTGLPTYYQRCCVGNLPSQWTTDSWQAHRPTNCSLCSTRPPYCLLH